MDLKIYRLEYPNHLGLKKELNQQGLRPLGTQVAIFQNEKGYESPLYERNTAVPLTLEASITELTTWRRGILEHSIPTLDQLSWVDQIEKVIKQRLIAQSDSEDLTEEILYFDQEYPMDRMEKPSALNRAGVKGTRQMGAYINKETCSPLYEWRTAVPLELETAKPSELKYWREGILTGNAPHLEKDEAQVLVEAITQELEQRQTKKKKTKKMSSSKKMATAVEQWQQLKTMWQEKPNEVCIVSVVGSGIFSQDEVLHLVVIDLNGELLCEHFFKPTTGRMTPLNNVLALKGVEWQQEWLKLSSLLKSRQLLIFNPEYEVRMIQQSCEKRRLESPSFNYVALQPIVKQLTGFSSLEGSTDGHAWRVNKSELAWNARLSAYLLLSIINPEADHLKISKDLNQL